VERNIIFTHELNQLDIFRVLPPFLPLVGVVSSDGNVSNWSIVPNVEDLVFISLKRNRNTPLQISSNTSGLQSLLEPALGDGDGVL